MLPLPKNLNYNLNNMEYKFNKSTDEEHKEKIDSNLIYALWKSGCARGGAEAAFEVRTSFVGQGAKIEITVKGDDYGKIDKIKGTIYNNRYKGSVEIPEDIKPGENIWFEVKLSKQGLKGQSNAIPGMPQPLLVKMQWDKKEARRGDILKLQAEFEQIEEEAEATVIIMEYDQDGNHDKIATIPTTIKDRKLDLQWEYEYHEDTDEIPTDEEMKKYGKSYNPPEYFFVVLIDGARFGEEQESGLLEFKDWIEIELVDNEGNSIPDEQYTLHLPDGTQKQGRLDQNGQAMIEGLPPGGVTIEYPDLDGLEPDPEELEQIQQEGLTMVANDEDEEG